MGSQLLNRREMAQRARISAQHLDNLIRTGRGPRAFRLGWRIVCRESDFEMWLDSAPEVAAEKQPSFSLHSLRRRTTAVHK